MLPTGNLSAWPNSPSRSTRTSCRSRSGSTTSPRPSCGRRRTSGTSGRSSRGRSCRRPPRSASTASTSWPTRMGDPTGLTLPVALEELFWGDAGIGLAIFGSALAAAGIAGNGTPEQVIEWVPQCYGTADDIKLGAFCVSEPDAGSDVSSLRTRAVYDEANDEWVLNGTKAWITNGGIADVHVVVAAVDPALKGRGQASLHRPARARRACRRGRSTRSTASAPRTPPRSCSTTCACPGAACSAARRSSTPSWPGPARAATRARSSRRCRRSRPPARRSARRRSASPGPPTSTRSTTPRSARRSASRSS